jgi:hypothetical protein
LASVGKISYAEMKIVCQRVDGGAVYVQIAGDGD